MEVSWSTFILEIINFLVLVWILKHFLYKPVLDVIARRQAGIEKKLTDAEAVHHDAEQLQQQYQGRITEWEHERAQARETLNLEVEAERNRKMAELRVELAQEQQKAQVAEHKRQTEMEREITTTAMTQGAHFAARILQQAAGPDVETRLLELLLDELKKLTPQQKKQLLNNRLSAIEEIVVQTAYPLTTAQQQQLSNALSDLNPSSASLRFEQNRQLQAGALITIGSWLLGANLRDELQGFGELLIDE